MVCTLTFRIFFKNVFYYLFCYSHIHVTNYVRKKPGVEAHLIKATVFCLLIASISSKGRWPYWEKAI